MVGPWLKDTLPQPRVKAGVMARHTSLPGQGGSSLTLREPGAATVPAPPPPSFLSSAQSFRPKPI